jgi:RNA polymerase sigma-70 factor (ECF subfamily)
LKPTDEFRAFYEQHFRFAWGVLRRLGARDDELLDLLQEVFLVAYRKLPDFEGRSRTTTWLFSICHNVFRAARRGKHHRLNSQDEGVLESLPATHDAAEELLWARQLLLELPEEQRVVFLLFELEGMSGDEIAEALGIPAGTVRSRLRLARESFRRAVALATSSENDVEVRHV